MFRKTCPIVFCLLSLVAAQGVARTQPWERSTVPIVLALPDAVSVGSSFTGVVTLQSVAQSDTAVSLSASSGAVSVPATVTVLQGQTQAGFTGMAVSASSAVTVTATANGGSASDTIQVN